MIDPISVFTAVTTVWGGIQTAVKAGQNAEKTIGQIKVWAEKVADLQFAISQEEEKQKNPSIFSKVKMTKSDTAQAFDIYIAKDQLRQMEKDLKHLFYWGALHHKGADAYNEIMALRKQIRRRREEAVYRRERKIAKIKKMTIEITTGCIAVGLTLWLMIWTINLILEHAK